MTQKHLFQLLPLAAGIQLTVLHGALFRSHPAFQCLVLSLFRLSPLRLPPSFDYRDTCGPSPCRRLSRPRTTTTAPSPWASRPEGDHVSVRVERDSAT